MASRARPETVSTRTTRQEKLILMAAANADGLPLAEWIHQRIVPEARRRLSRELAGGGAGEALVR